MLLGYGELWPQQLGCMTIFPLKVSSEEVARLVKYFKHSADIKTFAKLIAAGCGMFIGRLTVNYLKYRLERRTYCHLPWMWSVSEIDFSLLKSFPFLLRSDRTGRAYEFLNCPVDSETGKDLPVVFVGPSVNFTPSVRINDSKYFAQIVNNQNQFPKDQGLTRFIEPLLGNGLVIATGAHHAKHRKLINPMFQHAELKFSAQLIEDNALDFVENFLPNQGFLITEETFKPFTLNVIIEYAFSGALDKAWMAGAWNSLIRIFRVQIIFRVLFGDILRYIPNPANVCIFLIRQKIRRHIAERRTLISKISATEASVRPFNAVESIVSDKSIPHFQTKTHADMDDHKDVLQATPTVGASLADRLILEGCSTEEIMGECCTFLLAGHDTTSNTLAWACYELARHPNAQAKAREELASQFGPGTVTHVTYDAVKQLEYVGSIVKETLRLWPAVPILTRSNHSDDLELGGLHIPYGATLELSVFRAHRDPLVWPEPDAFRPERWQSKEEASLRHAYAFLPFNAGPRNCIGQRFAQLEATITLSFLLSRYALSLAPECEGEGAVFPALIGTMQPKGLRVRCTPL